MGIFGLIGFGAELLQDYAHASQIHHAGLADDHDQRRAQAMELWEACVGPKACVLLVPQNTWAACELDHVRVTMPDQLPPGNTARLGPAPHGLIGVCPGRHVITTKVGADTFGTAFVLYPGETFALRFDRTARQWVRYTEAEAQGLFQGLTPLDLSLLPYTHAVVAAKMAHDDLKSSHSAMETCMSNLSGALQCLLRGLQAGDTAGAAERARMAIGREHGLDPRMRDRARAVAAG